MDLEIIEIELGGTTSEMVAWMRDLHARLDKICMISSDTLNRPCPWFTADTMQR